MRETSWNPNIKIKSNASMSIKWCVYPSLEEHNLKRNNSEWNENNVISE